MRLTRVLGVVASAAVVLASCSSSDDATQAGSSAGSGPATSTPATFTPGTSTDRPPSSAAPSEEPQSIGDNALPDLGNADIDVAHYDLDLDYDPETGELAATATLDIGVLDEIDTLSLDFVGLDVGQVEVDGDGADVEHDDEKLLIELPEQLGVGDETTVEITYGGVPEAIRTRALGNVAVGWQVRDGWSFVLAEPEGARSWYPVNDHPTDKATYDISVVVPNGNVAIANGKAATVEDTPLKGSAAFRYVMDRPMAPYLATVVTGPFEQTDPVERGGVEHSFWSEETESGGSGERAMAIQEDALSFLEELLGPYPFDTFSGVQLMQDDVEPFFDGVAIETQSVSIYGSFMMDPSTAVHETAHQWFGNSVSVTDWSEDLWWVEGFATYAMALYEEAQTGRKSQPSVSRGATCNPSAPTGELPLRHLFQESYSVGGATFGALRTEIGDEAFFEFLREFVDRYAYSNATTDDLIATAEDVSGDDLTDFFDEWLYC